MALEESLRGARWPLMVVLVLAGCAHAGRRVTRYVDDHRSQVVNIGINVISGSVDASPCVAPQQVPSADSAEVARFEDMIRGWEQETRMPGQSCIKWFSRTKQGQFISVQAQNVGLDGGYLLFIPRDTTKAGWAMLPW